MSKRGNSEGSLYQSSDGWRGYVWCTRPDGARYRKYVRGKTYNEARRNWLSLRDQARQGPVSSGIPKLAEFLAYWLKEIVEPNLSPKTYERYDMFSRLHIIPHLGGKHLDKIQVRDIRQWLNELAITCQCCAQGKDAAGRRTKRRRGKGRKGQRRIQRIEQAGKAWATPIQALLVAERCAALSGHDTDFVMIITVAYTGMRWSEVIGLGPDCIQDDRVDVSWKLYELNGRFYRGRPKDGSIRPADLPPFLAGMLADQGSMRARKCTCRNTEKPWCPGGRYVFLGPEQGHFRRSNYSERFFRPAADGCYPARGQRPAMPVLVDTGAPYPGRPVPPWPVAVPGQEFQPPVGRGVTRLVNDTATGRCAVCGRVWPRDWTVTSSRIWRAAPAAMDQDSRPPPIWPWRRGCRCSPA